jgi:hypothetical protein
MNNRTAGLPGYLFAIGFMGFMLFFIKPGAAFAAELAGRVEEIKGTAWAQTADEQPRKLEKGSPVYVTDKITTESNSSVQLRFEDNTKFMIGADSAMVIEQFIFKKPDQANSFSSRVLQGTFRFITGLIALEKPEAMEVNTTVATIGIRGTQVIGEAAATSATIILMEPEDKSRKSIIQVANQFGSVIIDEPGYGTEIPDEFSPPSPPRRMRLQTINNLMRSLQTIQRINIPRPRMP